jgi:hypothetical protein
MMPAPRLFDLPNDRGRPRLPPSHQSRTRSAGLQRPPPIALGNLKSLECSEFPRDYWFSRDFWLRSLEDRFPRDYWLSPSTLLTRNTPITIINEFCSRHKMRIKESHSTIEGADKRFGLFRLLATLKWPEGYDGYMRSIGSPSARRMVSGYPSDSPSPPTSVRSLTGISPRGLLLATGSGRHEVSDTDDNEAMGYGGLPFARPQSARYPRPAGMYSDTDDQLQSAEEQLFQVQQENERLRRSMMLSGSSISSPVEKEMAEMRAELTALRKDLFSSQQDWSSHGAGTERNGSPSEAEGWGNSQEHNSVRRPSAPGHIRA